LDPGGWTAPEVMPSVSSGGNSWVVGVGGRTTSASSPIGVTGLECEVTMVGFGRSIRDGSLGSVTWEGDGFSGSTAFVTCFSGSGLVMTGSWSSMG